jgi:polar amino acid transport system substrate-binding protein
MKLVLPCWLVALTFLTVQASSTWAQDAVSNEIAPHGRLRGAVIGISVLGGIGEPIGRFIAAKVGATFELVIYPNPQAYEASFGKEEWDIALGPRVLAPSDKADVTPDVWLIELLYLAAAGHDFASAADVDRNGVRVGTIQNSPSDRILTRNVEDSRAGAVAAEPEFSGGRD